MMANQKYQPLDVVLLQELSRMFPKAEGSMIMDTLMRNNNHREKCIEDLSLSCAGHCNVSNDSRDRYIYGHRSQSVSGVPGDIRSPDMGNSYSYHHEPTPQSAPVTSGHDSPFSEIRLSLNSSGGGEPTASYTSTSSRFVRPPKPPVPPPTYRSVHQHEFLSPSQRYPYVNNFPSEQSFRHKTSLIIAPARLPISPGNWNFPMNGRPPFLMAPSLNAWGPSGTNEPLTNNRTPASNHPCQSQLHISISPDGGCFSASRSDSPAPTNSLHPNQYVIRPSYSSQSSPRAAASKMGNDGFQLSLVDMDDPEQRKITQIPLKPATSPLPNYGERTRHLDWPGQSFREAEAGEEAYTKDLIVHQKQKLNDVEREVELLTKQTEHEMRGLLLLEWQYFRSLTNPKESVFFSFHELQNLRAEVRSLMADCQNMTRLVDLLLHGQVPLGETGEEFYRSIHTGQQGPVLVTHESRQPQQARRPAMPPHPLPQSPLDNCYRTDVTVNPGTSSAGRATSDEDDQKWACCACTFLNSSSKSMCEMCEMPKFVQASV
ncbi:hypothetical protein CHUAL_007481 [Chamberlinius hualienensis]